MKTEKTKVAKDAAKKQTFQGKVVSAKMQKTVVVDVSRFVKHPKYGKFYTINKRIKAHDENGEYKLDDVVEIEATKPISKGKSFVVTKKIR